MIFRKDFDTPYGYTASIVVCRSIRFNPENNTALILLDFYKELTEYNNGAKACNSVEIEVKESAYEAFITSSDIYNKASNYLISIDQILNGAEVIE